MKKRLNKDTLLRLSVAVFIFAFMLLIFIAAWYFTSRDRDDKGIPASAEEGELSNSIDFYPEKLVIGQDMNSYTITDTKGKKLSLSAFNGKRTLIMFWASWCPYCMEDFELYGEIKEELGAYDKLSLVFLNKLDGEKETRKKAQAAVKSYNIPEAVCYSDKDAELYNEFGVKRLPTLLALDEAGKLFYIKAGSIEDKEELLSILDYVAEGPEKSLLSFITDKLTTAKGKILSTIRIDASTQEDSTLSEAYGLMLEYAAKAEDRELFERYYSYLKENMQLDNGLYGWSFNNGSLSGSNALVDELRIFKALSRANSLWGGFETDIKELSAAILKYNTEQLRLINSYDTKAKQKEEKLSLCFADFEALKALIAENPDDIRFSELYDNALLTVKNGYIGGSLPLYADYYDYSKNKYSYENMNMAESMYTLLNMAKLQMLSEETVGWLKDRLSTDGIKARYNSDGTVQKGYNYEAASIYALAVMIADELGDSAMKTKALIRMERFRRFDSSSVTDGAFGIGEDFLYSFDQLMALLAY
jgi:thiol-disulfide isomerase/thioredoxin